MAKTKRKKSPTQRALEVLRGHGYQAAVVERWNPHARVRQDLFGFVDVLAVGPGGTVAVQATSSDNASKRVAKITGEECREEVARCLAAGWLIEIWGFRRAPDRHGSTLLARSLVAEEDGTLRVAECSLAIEHPWA